MRSKPEIFKLCLFLVSIFFYVNVFSQTSFLPTKRNSGAIQKENNASRQQSYLFDLKISSPVLDTTKKDRDGDGIPDSLDKCPDEKGVIEYDGCPVPDSDNDGIADDKDACPTIRGLAKYKGCPPPDRDGDKINDEDDKCPDTPGVARYNGCPVGDKDGDGVNDDDDKCIDVAGTAAHAGCPEIKKSAKQAGKSATDKKGSRINRK